MSDASQIYMTSSGPLPIEKIEMRQESQYCNILVPYTDITVNFYLLRKFLGQIVFVAYDIVQHVIHVCVCVCPYISLLMDSDILSVQ